MAEGGDVKDPTCIVVLGMAGSGKTTFVQQLTCQLYKTPQPPYVINLDPACIDVPYPVNVDIRDTVKYKDVMKKYELGPNGAIITSLNLFSTRFDQVLGLLDKKKQDHKYIIFDTPGQIEVFTWSASGTIITESLASAYPTVIVYVMDIVKSANPITFMSNMLYACSILYKTKLPFVIAFNKIDVVDHSFAETWMKDFDAFEKAVDGEKSYMANLTRSLSLVLDKFYENIRTVGVSAGTGQGMEDFFVKVDEAVKEYHEEYKPLLEKLKKESAERKLKQDQENKEEKPKKEPRIAFGRQDAGQNILVDEVSDDEDDRLDD